MTSWAEPRTFRARSSSVRRTGPVVPAGPVSRCSSSSAAARPISAFGGATAVSGGRMVLGATALGGLQLPLR